MFLSIKCCCHESGIPKTLSTVCRLYRFLFDQDCHPVFLSPSRIGLIHTPVPDPLRKRWKMNKEYCEGVKKTLQGYSKDVHKESVKEIYRIKNIKETKIHYSH